MDFFGAATQTTNYGIQTLVSKLTQRLDVLTNIRNEFKRNTENLQEKMKDKKKGEALKEILNL